MKAEEFDEAFDRGEDVIQYLDLSSAHRPNLEPQEVNLEFPKWMVTALDSEAMRLGLTREAIIKAWLAQDLRERTAG